MTSWTVAHQAPLFMTFSKQEYWRSLPFPSPGDIPDPGIKATYPSLAGGFLTTKPPGKLIVHQKILAEGSPDEVGYTVTQFTMEDFKIH